MSGPRLPQVSAKFGLLQIDPYTKVQSADPLCLMPFGDYAKKALKVAKSNKQKDLGVRIQRYINLYKRNMPLRGEAPPDPPMIGKFSLPE